VGLGDGDGADGRLILCAGGGTAGETAGPALGLDRRTVNLVTGVPFGFTLPATDLLEDAAVGDAPAFVTPTDGLENAPWVGGMHERPHGEVAGVEPEACGAAARTLASGVDRVLAKSLALACTDL